MIHKKELSNKSGFDSVRLPANAKILHAGVDVQGVICVWYSFTPTMQSGTDYEFVCAWTGDEVDHNLYKHLSSFVHGHLVWHVFWRLAP